MNEKVQHVRTQFLSLSVILFGLFFLCFSLDMCKGIFLVHYANARRFPKNMLNIKKKNPPPSPSLISRYSIPVPWGGLITSTGVLLVVLVVVLVVPGVSWKA